MQLSCHIRFDVPLAFNDHKAELQDHIEFLMNSFEELARTGDVTTFCVNARLFADAIDSIRKFGVEPCN